MRKRINILQRLCCMIRRNLFGRTSYKWCVVGNTIGRHVWTVRKEECINGIPKKAGGFLQIYECDSEDEARSLLVEFEEIAERANMEDDDD